MTVRAKPLGSVNIASATTTTVFTCPTDKTAIVKMVSVAVLGGALNNTMTVRATVSGITQPFFTVTLSAGQVAMVLPYVVLAPGDSLEVITSGTNSSRCAAYGAVLAGVAP